MRDSKFVYCEQSYSKANTGVQKKVSILSTILVLERYTCLELSSPQKSGIKKLSISLR